MADWRRLYLRTVAEDALGVMILVRAYSEALECRYADQSFRSEMRDVMKESVARLGAAVERLEELAGQDDDLDPL